MIVSPAKRWCMIYNFGKEISTRDDLNDLHIDKNIEMNVVCWYVNQSKRVNRRSGCSALFQ
jgi:hypothetical protein